MENQIKNYEYQDIAEELNAFRQDLTDEKNRFQKMSDEKKLENYEMALEILQDVITDFEKTILVTKEIKKEIFDEIKIVRIKREKND